MKTTFFYLGGATLVAIGLLLRCQKNDLSPLSGGEQGLKSQITVRSVILLHVLLFLLFLVLISQQSAFSQNNQIGVNLGMSNYGNQFLSSDYRGKYVAQNGTSLDVGLSYSRDFSDKGKDITLYFGYTERTKNIFSDSIPNALQQSFFSMNVIHHHTTIDIVNEKLSLRVGSGLYWNMLLTETNRSMGTETETLSSGTINNVGILIDVPLDIRLSNNQSLVVGMQFSADIINSVRNSNLFVFKPYIGTVFRF